MPDRVVVIGGGFSGLTSASYLSHSGYKLTVIEAAGKNGGRAYSFPDPSTKNIIDNGQHILMGCYTDTLKFLKLIGADDNFYIQNKLRIDFVERGGERHQLKASHLPYPFSLLSAIVNYKALSLKDKYRLLRFLLKIPFILQSDLQNLSVKDWLTEEKQTERAIKSFWDILVIGSLNTNAEKASAYTFYTVLKEIFLKGERASTIVLPLNGLSESYVVNAENYLLEREVELCFNEQVTDLVVENNSIVKIITSKREITEFDSVVSSVPLYSLRKILRGNHTLNFPELTYSSILNIHIWLRHNPLKEKFYGLIDSKLHWVFNKGDHINLVISDADQYEGADKAELITLFKGELKEYFKISPGEIINYRIIREKRATFVPEKKIIDKRPAAVTDYENLFLAGDWTDTGLPSTIESATKSGRLAAEALMRRFPLKPSFKNVIQS